MVIAVRRLKDSDRDDVIEIARHTWEGHDYLLSVADQWLHDPDCHFYGVEVEGHVVAVGNLRLVEEGRTGWMEGLRVHPEHRGKGYANRITLYIVRKAEHLGVQRLRYTTARSNTASLKLAKLTGFSTILRMAVRWQLKPKPTPMPDKFHPIRKTSPEKVCDLLKTNSEVIRHGILVYDWKALDNTCSNIQEIAKTHTFYIAKKSERLDSLSFGWRRDGPDQTAWSFTIYATDADSFLAQLSHNIAIALKSRLNMVMCTFETKFQKTLKEVDLGSEEHHGTQLVLLEKQMRKARSSRQN